MYTYIPFLYTHLFHKRHCVCVNICEWTHGKRAGNSERKHQTVNSDGLTANGVRNWKSPTWHLNFLLDTPLKEMTSLTINCPSSLTKKNDFKDVPTHSHPLLWWHNSSNWGLWKNRSTFCVHRASRAHLKGWGHSPWEQRSLQINI